MAKVKTGDKPKGKSTYARKAAYLRAHGGWGFEYAAPKPWKGKA